MRWKTGEFGVAWKNESLHFGGATDEEVVIDMGEFAPSKKTSKIVRRVAVPKDTQAKGRKLRKPAELSPTDHRHFLAPMVSLGEEPDSVRFYDLNSNARQFAFNENRNHVVPVLQPTHALFSKTLSERGCINPLSKKRVKVQPLNIQLTTLKAPLTTIISERTVFANEKLRPDHTRCNLTFGEPSIMMHDDHLVVHIPLKRHILPEDSLAYIDPPVPRKGVARGSQYYLNFRHMY
jgi:hypothetical protein